MAYLNNIGVIDAILSDDVDNFLFGAKVVIRKSVSYVLPDCCIVTDMPALSNITSLFINRDDAVLQARFRAIVQTLF